MSNRYISGEERRKLSRDIHPMPGYVAKALKSEKLEGAYRARPAYQKNDYVGWITGAKQPETQQKRLRQMITELRGGKKYMKMRYSPS